MELFTVVVAVGDQVIWIRVRLQPDHAVLERGLYLRLVALRIQAEVLLSDLGEKQPVCSGSLRASETGASLGKKVGVVHAERRRSELDVDLASNMLLQVVHTRCAIPWRSMSRADPGQPRIAAKNQGVTRVILSPLPSSQVSRAFGDNARSFIRARMYGSGFPTLAATCSTVGLRALDEVSRARFRQGLVQRGLIQRMQVLALQVVDRGDFLGLEVAEFRKLQGTSFSPTAWAASHRRCPHTIS